MPSPRDTGRYPAQAYDPAERISRPGATSDFGRIGHFAGAAYTFLAKMVKMSSQGCCRRARDAIRLKTEGGGAVWRWQGTASANVRVRAAIMTLLGAPKPPFQR